MSEVKSEDSTEYRLQRGKLTMCTPKVMTDEDELIASAIAIIWSRLGHPGEEMRSPDDVKNYLILQMAELEHEVFSVILMDKRHRVIKYQEMFRGTIDGSSVHPREVVKAALANNAAACIVAHNHPSCVPEPGQADKRLTARLRDALALVDVRVLDHIIVGGTETVSFAERGLI